MKGIYLPQLVEEKKKKTGIQHTLKAREICGPSTREKRASGDWDPQCNNNTVVSDGKTSIFTG